MNVLDALQIHARRSKAVGDFAGRYCVSDPTSWKWVVRHFHAIQPDFPAGPQAPSVGDSQSSSTKRMSCSLSLMPKRFQRMRVEFLDVEMGEGFEHHWYW